MALKDRRVLPKLCQVPGCTAPERADFVCDACGKAICGGHAYPLLHAPDAVSEVCPDCLRARNMEPMG